MYHKVLLAYDGSRDGRKALAEGARLAIRCDAEVILLAVVDMAMDVANAEGYTSSMAVETQIEQLKEILAEGRQRLEGEGLKASARLAFGMPGEQIAAIATEVAADLVVIGHREHGLWARWLHEPVGAYLMKHLPCSLLVVQPPGETETDD